MLVVDHSLPIEFLSHTKSPHAAKSQRIASRSVSQRTRSVTLRLARYETLTISPPPLEKYVFATDTIIAVSLIFFFAGSICGALRVCRGRLSLLAS